MKLNPDIEKLTERCEWHEVCDRLMALAELAQAARNATKLCIDELERVQAVLNDPDLDITGEAIKVAKLLKDMK